MFTPPPAQSARRRRLSALLRLFVFVAVVAGAWWWLQRHSGGDPKGWLEAMRSTNPFVFIILMATLPVIGFPIMVCYLYAGAAFGFLWGWLYCLAGLSLSMSLGYWVARGLLRVPLQSLLAATTRRLPAPSARHHVRTTLLARLVPGLSFALQNALLALLGIPFCKYLAASLAAQGLLAALMCAISSIGQRPHWVSVLLIAAAAMGVCLLAHFGIRRGWRQKQAEPVGAKPVPAESLPVEPASVEPAKPVPAESSPVESASVEPAKPVPAESSPVEPASVEPAKPVTAKSVTTESATAASRPPPEAATPSLLKIPPET